MTVKCEQYNRVCVLELPGDFVGDTAAEIKKTLDQQIEHGRITDFILDFHKAGFVDSEGLEALLWMKRRCEDLFGQLKLVQLQENCRKILELTRLSSRFECHSDLATALKTMR